MPLKDDEILQAMAMFGAADRATYVVRNILAGEHGLTRLKTSTVLSRLKRMERVGRVERVPSSYAVMICWKVVGN